MTPAWPCAEGHLTTLKHFWDVLGSSGTYTSYAVPANACTYDPTLGLKTSSSFYTQGVLQRTEAYGYDPLLDYLTGASYNDGLPNANPSWSYDAAGNRTDAVCDNLNRPTSIQGVGCTSDILGNRLTTGSNSYGWDALNRMTAMNANAYQYRADGMRVAKTVAGVLTRFRYDGQMGMEDADSTGKVTQYGLGARGIDFMQNPAPSGGWAAFPLYDGHGNMVATLARGSNGTFTVGNQRSFDCWGNVRLGALTGDPSLRHCGNLGHKQDDESGLIYMRARYYEPGSGRFISEDSEAHGRNWFAYSKDDPVNYADRTGNDAESILIALAIMAGIAVGTPLGYWLGGMLIMAMNPGYKAGNIFASAMEGIAFGCLGGVGGLKVASELLASGDIKACVLLLRLEIMQSGAAVVTGPFGLGLLIGLIIGVLTAVIEYYGSDYYQEH